MTILGIETSCDDTAAAVVVEGALRSSVVSSQQREHGGFGGVVPELASRAHQRLILPVVQQALAEAGAGLSDLGAVAVTYGPGLAGSLLVGLSFAKALAFGRGVPLVGINHLEGHVYSVFLAPPGPAFPFLCLLVSGGHTQLVLVEAGFRHTVLGQTRDDAAGEAFDKVARLLGLGYPGGPRIDELARQGDPAFHVFPRTRFEDYTFSFSGIKTAVLYYLQRIPEVDRTAVLARHLPDLCAAFQQAVVEMLIEPLRRALRATGVRQVALVGGVSANTALRAAAASLCADEGAQLYVPPLAWCMDNAAMIALTASYKLAAGQTSPLTLTAEPNLVLRPLPS
jgi:N6-L-threonylcarbamoyladenine synthase